MEVLQDKGVPLLEQEGWTRHQENAAKHPLKGADGVVSSGKYLENDHPVCAALERELFLNGAASPPFQGGEYQLSKEKSRCPVMKLQNQ
jgi:hypothetical protein